MPVKRMARRVFLAGLLCVGSGLAGAQNLPPYGISVYSNLCVSPMSDDLYGARITLRRLANGDNLLVYEYSDGSNHALIAEKLVLDEVSGTVRFELHGEGGLDASVTGKFSADGNILTARGMLFERADRRTALKRVTDFDAAIEKCQQQE